MRISEPATLATDYLLGALCLLWALRLARRGSGRCLKLWSIGFLLVGAAGLAGGTFHGFRTEAGAALLAQLWNATMVLIGGSAGFMISGCLVAVIGRARPWLASGLAVTLAGLAVMVARVRPSPSFNQNDLFHCIQMAGLYLFYRGALLLRDR